MKATSGNLRIDQNYTLDGNEYLGGFENGSMDTCENCGLAIVNVAIVKGSIDKITYRIGIDCAGTLTSINPSEIAQAKKELSRKARFIKRIKTDCTFAIINKSMAWFYKKPQVKWQSYWLARCYIENAMPIIKSMNMPYIIDNN